MKTHKYVQVVFVLLVTIFSACQQKKDVSKTASQGSPLLQDTISDSTARRLVNNFSSRANHIKKGELLMPDTRCVWFSVSQIDSLAHRINREGGDGIRFYFAAYDKTSRPDLHKIDSSYRDYTTLVMVSTHDSIGLHFDYYHSSKSNKGIILTSVPENQGELCPPPITCAAVGATLLQ